MNQGMLITRVACAALAVLPLAAGQHACQTLGETFLKKCNTSSQSAGSSCPTGCMDAYKAFVSNSGKKCTEWTEAVPGGMSNLMVESFGMTTFGWGGQTPNTTNATVENYVRFGTIVNRLADRCEWPGMHGTCEYHYILALETADEPPGDVHGYNCSTTKSRDVCSGECKSLLSKAEKYCKPGHSYSGRNGMTTSYSGMMGALRMQQSCANFTCTPGHLGSSFCESLFELARTGSTTVASGVNIGCEMNLNQVESLINPGNGQKGLLSSAGYDLPYRGEQCLAQLSTDSSTKSVKLKDICYCTTHSCPNDDRKRGGKCVNGVKTPPAAPPSPPPAASGALPAGASNLAVVVVLVQFVVGLRAIE